MRISPLEDPVANRFADDGCGLNCSAEMAPLACRSMVDRSDAVLLLLLLLLLPLMLPLMLPLLPLLLP